MFASRKIVWGRSRSFLDEFGYLFLFLLAISLVVTLIQYTKSYPSDAKQQTLYIQTPLLYE